MTEKNNDEKNSCLTLPGLSIFLDNLKLLFITNNDLKDITGTNTEIMQPTEPTTQKTGDYWPQEY